MPWNIAQAKQRFSELIRQAAEEPQLIFSRGRLVAAMVAAGDFEAFRQWKENAKQKSLDDEFADLRALMADEDYVLDVPRRSTRASQFDAPVEPAGREFSA